MNTPFKWLPIGLIVFTQAAITALLAYITYRLSLGYDAVDWYGRFAAGFIGASAGLHLYYLLRSLKVVWEMVADGE
jgi:hypothetical protein